MSRAHFADIAFPTAVRQLFTYQVPTELHLKPGMRVWVPLRNEKSIGVVIRVHSQKPDFEVKSVLQVLDQEPILSQELLKLLDWIHQFYYCSMGEVVQAALPSGLNFISEKRIRLKEGKRPEELAYHSKDKETALEILLEIEKKSTRRAMKLSDAKKTWRGLKS
jgi:primosomal protein N' (replication factor Y)